jgi:predicted metal-dependent peptidase
MNGLNQLEKELTKTTEYIKFDAKTMTTKQLEEFLSGPDIPYEQFDFFTFKQSKYIRTKRIMQSLFPVLSYFIENINVLVITDTYDNNKKDLNRGNKTAFTNGLDIYFHSRFAEALTPEQFTGIYIHELFHIILDHTKRRQNRNPILHNIACDYFIERVISEIVGKKEYSSLIANPSFSCLDRTNSFDNMSSEEIYEYLFNQKPKLKDNESTANYGNKSSIDISSDGKVSINGDIIGDLSDLASSKVYNSDGELVDMQSHLSKSESREGENENQRSLINDNKEAVFGTLSALFEREFNIKIEAPKVDWRKTLKEFLRRKFSADYSYYHRSATQYSSPLIMPSLVDDDNMIKIGVVIDTSGSMGKEEMDNAMNELWAIMSIYKKFQITLMCCDAEIDYKNIKTIKKKHELYDFQVGGGGGTSFVPPFNYFDNQVKDDLLDVLLYFTDCYGDYPQTKKRNYETLWVVTHDGIKDTKDSFYPPFGKVTHLI